MATEIQEMNDELDELETSGPAPEYDYLVHVIGVAVINLCGISYYLSHYLSYLEPSILIIVLGFLAKIAFYFFGFTAIIYVLGSAIVPIVQYFREKPDRVRGKM